MPPVIHVQVEAGSSPFLRGCYCSSLPSTTAIADSICAVWLQSEGYVLALQNVASLIVAVVNMLLVQALTRLTRFERHHSIDKMQLSLSTRIFLAQFVNTAFLSLVLRADIPFLPSSGIRYSDFEPGWYLTAYVDYVHFGCQKSLPCYAAGTRRWVAASS